MKNKMSIINKVFYTGIPLILSSVMSVIAYNTWLKSMDIESLNMQGVIGTILGIWGTFFGFIITAVSILIAFNGSSITQEIRDSGHYQTVMFLYIVTCAIIFIAILFFLPIYIVNVASVKILAFLIFFMLETMMMLGIDILLLFLILRTATS